MLEGDVQNAIRVERLGQRTRLGRTVAAVLGFSGTIECLLEEGASSKIRCVITAEASATTKGGIAVRLSSDQRYAQPSSSQDGECKLGYAIHLSRHPFSRDSILP